MQSFFLQKKRNSQSNSNSSSHLNLKKILNLLYFRNQTRQHLSDPLRSMDYRFNILLKVYLIVALKNRKGIFVFFDESLYQIQPRVCQDYFCTTDHLSTFLWKTFFVEKRVQRYVKHMDQISLCTLCESPEIQQGKIGLQFFDMWS